MLLVCTSNTTAVVVKVRACMMFGRNLNWSWFSFEILQGKPVNLSRQGWEAGKSTNIHFARNQNMYRASNRSIMCVRDALIAFDWGPIFKTLESRYPLKFYSMDSRGVCYQAGTCRRIAHGSIYVVRDYGMEAVHTFLICMLPRLKTRDCDTPSTLRLFFISVTPFSMILAQPKYFQILLIQMPTASSLIQEGIVLQESVVNSN